MALRDLLPAGIFGGVVALLTDLAWELLFTVVETAELWVPILGRLDLLAGVFGFLTPLVPYSNQIAWIGSAFLLGTSLARVINSVTSNE